MTIIKLSIAAAAMALSVPALATPAEPAAITLEHEGRSYVYTVRDQRSARIIEGVEQTSGTPFSLRVRGDMVRGRYGSAPVAFRVSDARGTVTQTLLASR